jgi:hypothetical protein
VTASAVAAVVTMGITFAVVGGNWRRRGLPVVFPPCLFQEIQISIPATCRLFRVLRGNLTAQITYKSYPQREGCPRLIWKR